MDDEIYADFQEAFPDFDPAKPLVEDDMKSKEGKEAWRNWMMKYEKRIEDFNGGTMLRADPKIEYSQENTIFGEKNQRLIRMRDGHADQARSHADAVLRYRNRQVRHHPKRWIKNRY